MKIVLKDKSVIEWDAKAGAYVRTWPDNNRQKVMTYNEVCKLVLEGR